MSKAIFKRSSVDRSILVLNPKGGCGKSTISTTIASYFAIKGKTVSLVDCDPQTSSLDWLAARPSKLARIHGIGYQRGELKVKSGTDIVVIDSPASASDAMLSKLIPSAHTIVIPVLPSPVDIRAATRFIQNLHDLKSQIRTKVKMCTVANRVNEETIIAYKLDDYLDGLKLPGGTKIPFITVLRSSQNYIHAQERGASIFEIAPSKTYYDREQWEPLLKWLRSKRSLPSS